MSSFKRYMTYFCYQQPYNKYFQVHELFHIKKDLTTYKRHIISHPITGNDLFNTDIELIQGVEKYPLGVARYNVIIKYVGDKQIAWNACYQKGYWECNTLSMIRNFEWLCNIKEHKISNT